MKKIHAFVISWEGKHDSSLHIASNLSGLVDKLTVIYSNAQNMPETGPGNWVQLENSFFFGRKFERALRLFQEDVFLLIHADASSDQWIQIVHNCRLFMSMDSVGVWAPAVSHTPWVDEKVLIYRDEINNIGYVAQTDGIVFSLSSSVVNRLKSLDYSENNLGWGIDWAAISHAFANNLLVIRDYSIKVHHPEGTGYQKELAYSQMQLFMTQFSAQELISYKLLKAFTERDSSIICQI